MAFFFPTYDELQKLKVPLEPGELCLINFLRDNLDDSFEVYVQPFLNGDRPDIVIIRKNYGILIIEVKDWNFEHYKLDEKKRWHLKSNNVIIKSPINQTLQYKENLYNLHIANLLEKKTKDFKYWSLVACAIYFHNESYESVSKMMLTPYAQDENYMKFIKYNIDLLGRDSLNQTNFNLLLKKKYLVSSRPSPLFNDETYISFKRFLNPPKHTKEEGVEFPYSIQQQKLIISKLGDQRIKGVVGSGKTTVLAARAVNAHKRTSSQVLILTYNITLKNYIHDKISRIREDFDWSAFYITNYHNFINSVINDLGIAFELPDDFDSYPEESKSKYFEEKYYSNINLFSGYENRINKYSSILIDEIQDYKRAWMDIIKKYFLTTGGEYIIFGDEKQNIYGNELNQKDIVTNVVGKPSELKHCFRSDKKIKDIAVGFQNKKFAEKYDIDTLSDTQQELKFEKAGYVNYMFLENINSVKALFLIVYEISKKLNEHPNDITILGSSIKELRYFDAYYRYKTNEKTNTMFETQEAFFKILLGKLQNEPILKTGIELSLKNIDLEKKKMLLSKLLTIAELIDNYDDDSFVTKLKETCLEGQIDETKFTDWRTDFLKEFSNLLDGKIINKQLKGIRENKKTNFWYNRGTIKISTIHSFKGWEANTLFLILDPQNENHLNTSFDELVYTGITRSKENLIVLNFGKEKYDLEMRQLMKQN